MAHAAHNGILPSKLFAILWCNPINKKKITIRVRLGWITEDYLNWSKQASNTEYSPPYEFTSNDGTSHKFKIILYPRGKPNGYENYMAVKIFNDGTAKYFDYE